MTLPAYRFIVELDLANPYLPGDQPNLIPEIEAEEGFQEVTGLGAELEVMPYPEGGLNEFMHQLPVRHKWNNITLKRGITGDLAFWNWILNAMNGQVLRTEGSVVLLGAAPCV